MYRSNLKTSHIGLLYLVLVTQYSFCKVTLWQCAHCKNDFENPSKYCVERHMLERHSGFGYQCSTCKNVFPRSSVRHSCSKRGLNIAMTLVRRMTMERGPEVEAAYEAYAQNCKSSVVPVKRRLAEVGGRQEKNLHRAHSHISQLWQKDDRSPSPKRCKSSTPLQRITVLEKSHQTFTKELASPLKQPKVKRGGNLQPNPCNLLETSSVRLHHPGPASDAISPPVQEEDAISILAEVDDDFESIHTESLYSPKPRTPAKAPSVAYIPTPTQVLRVQQIKLAQDKRVILNVGGQKFETSVSTLQKDPSSVLAYMVMPDSPLKPYNTDSVYTYFIDRDPSHFRHILNYLRNGGGDTTNTLPHDLRYLIELQREAEYYNLQHFSLLLERRLAITTNRKEE